MITGNVTLSLYFSSNMHSIAHRPIVFTLSGKQSFQRKNNNDDNNTFFIQGYSISYNILAAINRSTVLRADKKCQILKFTIK